MGLFGAAFGLGFIFGPAIAGVLSKYGVHVPFYFAAGLSSGQCGRSLFYPARIAQAGSGPTAGDGRIASRAVRVAREPRISSMINIVYFLLVTAFSIMTYAFVLYTAYRFGYNAEQNGYLFAFVGLVSIVAQGVLFGPLVKRFGEAHWSLSAAC